MAKFDKNVDKNLGGNDVAADDTANLDGLDLDPASKVTGKYPNVAGYKPYKFVNKNIGRYLPSFISKTKIA